MRFRLIRVTEWKHATLGILLVDDKPEFKTLELPWCENMQCGSCIPEGVYTCKKILSPTFGMTFEVQNVRNRSNILFHIGNTPLDTHGCILLGETYGELEGRGAILQSRKAFNRFMDILRATGDFEITISNAIL